MRIIRNLVAMLAVNAIIVTSSSASSEADLVCEAAYFVDESATKNIQEVVQKVNDWVSLTDKALGLGFSRANLWVKVRCRGNPKKSGTKIVSFNYPLLDEVVHFGPDSAQLGVAGDLRSISGSAIPDRNPAFTVQFLSFEEPHYFRIKTLGSLQAPISIVNPDQFAADQRGFYFFGGIYYGVMVAVFLYNIIIFLVCRDSLFLIYSFFIASYFGFQMGANGLWSSHLQLHWLQNQGLSMFMFWSGAMILTFATAFLRHQGITRWMRACANNLAILLAIGGIFSPFVAYRFTAPVGALVGTFIPTMVLIVSLHLWQKGSVSARVFIIAWAAYLSGSIVLGLKNLGWLLPHFITNNAIQIGSVIEMILISAALGMRFRSLEMANSQIQERLKATDAVARVTQMLAHDVRKPFSTLKIALDSLSKMGHPDEIKKFLARLIPDIEKAARHVDGLIADVLEVGIPTTQLIQEPISPRALIGAALYEIGSMYPDSEIRIFCCLEHVHMVNIHQQKIERVFANILGNAYQAMGRAGLLWIHTKEYNGKVEFCIGNDGPGLPEGDTSQFFDPFYTHGKKNGTGLGLAIAKKIVSAHGGDIWCSSSRKSDSKRGKVEFYFTLPVCGEQDSHRIDGFSTRMKGLQRSCDDDPCPVMSSDNRPTKSEIDCSKSSSSFLVTKPEVLIIEDNPFIQDAWCQALLPDAEAYSISTFERLEHQLAGDPNFLSRFFCIITDFNLEGSRLDGVEIARFIKKQCPRIPIFLSSDGLYPIASIDGAIDKVIGKDTISMVNLKKLIVKCVKETNLS